MWMKIEMKKNDFFINGSVNVAPNSYISHQHIVETGKSERKIH